MLQHVLTPEDVAWATRVGNEREDEARRRGLYPRFDPATTRTGHVVGAQAELAFARALELPWPARVNTFRSEPDVDPFWEVRWSSNPRKVKVVADDPAHYLVAHVTGQSPSFEILGFIVAGYVQKHYPMTDPGEKGAPAYFVEAYKLSPIDPGFHAICQWAKLSAAWTCVFCGALFDQPTP